MIEGCIFDIEGVLIDSDKYNFLSLKKALREINNNLLDEKSCDLDEIEPLESFDKLMNIASKNLNKKEMDDLLNLKKAYYSNFMSKLSSAELKPGLKRFLINLRMLDIKIAASSTSLNTKAILENLEISKFFDVIFNENSISSEYPKLLTKTAEELEVTPENCAVFENNVYGINAAKNANMYAIGVGSPTVIKNADKVISNFSSINASILKI